MNSLPLLPATIIFSICLHGLFDGFALRMSSPSSMVSNSSFILYIIDFFKDLLAIGQWEQGSSVSVNILKEQAIDQEIVQGKYIAKTVQSGFSAISLSLIMAVIIILHRIPESLLIWRYSCETISMRCAVMALSLFGVFTFLGFIMSNELLREARGIYINISYFPSVL